MTEALRKRLRQCVYGLLTIGAALLAIVGAEARVEGLVGELPLYVMHVVAVGGSVGVVVGILLLPVVWFFPAPSFRSYEFVRAKRRNLEGIHRMGKNLLGGHVSELAQMRAWFDLNPNIFRVIRRVRRNARRRAATTVGYLCVLPLKEKARKEVHAGQLSGITFTKEHILAPRSRPKAVYIGAIAAETRVAMAAALHFLKGYVALLESQGCESAYARPTTHDGLRVVTKHDFTPTSGQNPSLGSTFVLELHA